MVNPSVALITLCFVFGSPCCHSGSIALTSDPSEVLPGGVSLVSGQQRVDGQTSEI